MHERNEILENEGLRHGFGGAAHLRMPQDILAPAGFSAAGDRDDLDVPVELLQLQYRFEPFFLGHDDIGDYDRTGCARVGGEPLDPVGRGGYGKTRLFQGFLEQGAQIGFILDDQNGRHF